MKKNNRKTGLLLLALSGLFFLCGYVINYRAQRSINPEKYARQLEKTLRLQENEALGYFRESSFINNALKSKLLERELKDLESKAYTLCIYKGDSLLFWSNNKILPYKDDIYNTPKKQTINLVKLKKGYYELMQDRYTADNGQTYTLVTLIPIYYEYLLHNDYFKNSFAQGKEMPRYVELSENEGVKIKATNGQELFGLKITNNEGKRAPPAPTFFFYLVGFFFLILGLTYISAFICNRYSSLTGLLFFMITVIIARILTTMLGFTRDFSHMQLFSPEYYAVSDIMNSLGDLLINVLLILWTSVFMHRKLRFRKLQHISTTTRYGLATLVYTIIIASLFLIGFIYDSLILNSEISLEIDNVFSLNIYSFVGLLSVTLLAAAFFFFAHKLTLLLSKLKLSQADKLIYLGLAILTFTILNFFNFLPLGSLFLLLFALFVVILFEFFIQNKSLSMGWLFGWIIMFSMFSSVILYKLNEEKGLRTMSEYAEKLAQDTDFDAEKDIGSVLRDIKADNFVKSFFKNSVIYSRESLLRTIDSHIEGYLSNHYEYKVHTYQPLGSLLLGEDTNYDQLVEKIDAGIKTLIPELFLWSNDKGDSEYITELIVKDPTNNGTIGKLIIEFFPKPPQQSNVYPELLMDRRSKSLQKFEDLDYAIYRRGNRVDQKHKSFATKLDFSIAEGEEFARERRLGTQYLIHRPSAEKIVIVSQKREELVKPVSLFSYMFCLQLAVVLLMILFNRIVQALPKGIYRMNVGVQPSLRNRINLSVISVIIISFVAIGLVTVLYFQQEFTEYHEGRLERKVRGVMATANKEMEKQSSNPGFLPNVNELNEIHNMDINLYDLSGSLIQSSQKEIFSKGLISSKINPVAYYNLKDRGLEQHRQDEEINGLSYLAAYVPLYNIEKEKVAYLGLPYFSRQSNLRQDVSDFMGTLLNVYVLLFLVAGIVALFVGNSVTQPIVAIGEKLKQVKLGTKNEPLTWENDDEIGALVSEYNKMIKELENSAKLLAQSNREMAWREMARQVAHEIKNPLTPMRLSIQHLQRAYQTDPEQINRLSKTILEQIDNLSHIASEFSNFAKMPRAKNEYFELDGLVASVYDLFKERDNMDIQLDIRPGKPTTVFADKKQIMRVFNNLIKNAIQAIPEERTGEINVIMEREGENVVVKIEDNGIGIPEEKQSSIFVPNFTTKSSGTGLGLAMSRNIVENANGSIFFDTKERVGTTFYVELPVAKMTANKKIS